eukprot:gene36300-biopygen1242
MGSLFMRSSVERLVSVHLTANDMSRVAESACFLGSCTSETRLVDQSNYILDPDILDSVVTSQSACSVSVNILTDLLTFDKIEDGELKLDRHEMSVTDLVLSSTAIFQAQAREKGVMLTTEIAFDPRLLIRVSNDVAAENELEMRPENGIPVKTCRDVKAYVDRAKMSQVIHNLVSNGLKFTPPGGHVSVTVTLEEEPPSPRGNVYTSTPLRAIHESTPGSPSAPVFVKITVTDTGAGLSPENMKKLFKSAIQFNPEILQAGGGSGLGLF